MLVNNLKDKKLFIFIAENHSQSGGGSFISNRNFSFFSKIGAKHKSKVVKINSNTLESNWIIKLFKIIFKISISDLSLCIKLILKTSKDQLIHVWLDRSDYGFLILILKIFFFYKKIYFHTYFHNDEVRFIKHKFVNDVFFKRFFYLLIAKFAQKLSLILSKKLYFISKNERLTLAGGNGFFFPPTWPSSPVKKDRVPQSNAEPYILLVGSAFFANIRGFKWFIEECAPHLNLNTVIAGSGMSSFFSSGDKITVYDYVDDLSSLYHNSSAVIVPIFNGAGIKIKALEALIYEKYLVITDFAFEGLDYVFSDFDIFIKKANKASEFIESINNLPKSLNSKKELNKVRLLDEYYMEAYEQFLLS